MDTKTLMIDVFDLFGTHLDLRIFSNKKKKTLFGAILGFIYICLIVSISVYFFNGFFQKNTKIITQNSDSTILPYNDMSDKPIILTMRTNFGQYLTNDGTIYNYHAYKMYNNYTNGIFNGINITPLFIGNCTQELFGKVNIEEIPTAKIVSCIKPSKINDLKSTPTLGGVDGFGYLMIVISKCDNKTNPFKNCKSKEEIDTIINTSSLVVSTLTTEIDNNNLINPSIEKLTASYMVLSTQLYKIQSIFLTQNIYEDDQGLIFDRPINYKFFSWGYEKTDFSIGYNSDTLRLTRGNIPIAHYLIFNSPNTELTYRSFMKFQTLLAQIGGVSKILSLIASIINNLLTRKLIFAEIGDLLFQIEDKSNNLVKLNQDSRTQNKIVSELKPQIEILKIPGKENLDESDKSNNTPRSERVAIVKERRANVKYFKLSLWDMICYPKCISENNKMMKNYDIINEAIIKKISVESLVADSYHLDYLSKRLLDRNDYLEFINSKIKLQ